MEAAARLLESLQLLAAIEDGFTKLDDCGVTPDEFAAASKIRAFDPAVSGVLKQLEDGAPGRGPHPRADALSAWFNGLGPNDRLMVGEVVRNAAHAAVFHLLCILDGVSVIDDPPHVELVLMAVAPDGGSSVLASAQSVVELHDEFNALVHPPSEPWPADPK